MSDAQLSVTIKYKDDGGKGFDQPWAVFHGTIESIRDDIVEYFDMAEEEFVDLSLHSVVLNAQRYAHGVKTVSDALGGTIVAQDKGWGNEESSPVEADLWSTPIAAEPTQQELNVKLIDELLHAHDELALKGLWAKNKAAFSDPAVKAAYSKRGNELKGGGKSE